VLNLDGPAPSEDRLGQLFVLILAQAQRIPEPQRPACPQFTGEIDCAQWRCSVVRPVTPCLACQPFLEEHADDGHHCEAAIVQLCKQALFLLLGISDGRAARKSECAETLVVACELCRGRLQVSNLDEAHERHHLNPSQVRNNRQSLETHGDVLECEVR